jgi:hypothetical protein
MIVDHKLCRLGGNEAANLIVPTTFYVEELEKLGDNKAFLRACLWHCPNAQILRSSVLVTRKA